jgi:hypothetical protein
MQTETATEPARELPLDDEQPTIATATRRAVQRSGARIRGAAAALLAPFADRLPADRDRERLLADLRALPDAPADVESRLRR